MEKAERIYRELLHENTAIWYISDEYGAKVMVKIRTVTIKALIKGCPIHFLFGKDNVQNPAMFHTGVRVYDDPIHFVSITGMQRFMDEHMSVEQIMNRNKTHIHFHNELGVCAAIAELTFEIKDQLKVLNLLGRVDNLYIGEFSDLAKQSLDCFDYSLDNTRVFKNAYPIETLTIQGNLAGWTIMENHFVGVNECNKIVVNETNEGEVFEREIWAALESTFKGQIFKNPQIKYKNGTRELTDIFAYSDYSIFLIETKAIGILNTELERTMERKVANLQSQIGKAINQLIGASKKVVENVSIFSQSDIEICFNKSLLPHCVVLVSELLPFGEWKNTEMKIIKSMAENRMYLHVMDLKEFMKFIRASAGSKDRLDYFLMKRAEDFAKHPTIHLEANFIRDPRQVDTNSQK